MRVIAGTARGRPLIAPSGRGTRPTSDRVREALFSSLQPRLGDARVADLYAGSGALGIEALSRGASIATFVERARRAQVALRTNLARTGLTGDATMVPGEVRAVLRAGPPGAPFDLVFIDPPYDAPPDELDEVLRLLTAPTTGLDLLAPGATVIVERGRHSSPPVWPPPLRHVRDRRYGDTVLYEAQAPATCPRGGEGVQP